MDQNSHNDVLINYSKTPWPTPRDSNAIFEFFFFFFFFLQFTIRCIGPTLFFHKGVEIEQKHANFWLGV